MLNITILLQEDVKQNKALSEKLEGLMGPEGVTIEQLLKVFPKLKDKKIRLESLTRSSSVSILDDSTAGFEQVGLKKASVKECLAIK